MGLRAHRTALLALLLGLAACDDGGGSEGGAGGSSAGGDGGAGGTGGALAVDLFTPGLTHEGTEGLLAVRLIAADPASPGKGDNALTFEVLDAATDAAIADAQIVLEPVMPAHGHGTTPPRHTATSAAEGLYRVGPFALFMPGVWELRFHLTRGAVADEVSFRFRIEG